jgi:hypothetical protein
MLSGYNAVVPNVVVLLLGTLWLMSSTFRVAQADEGPSVAQDAALPCSAEKAAMLAAEQAVANARKAASQIHRELTAARDRLFRAETQAKTYRLHDQQVPSHVTAEIEGTRRDVAAAEPHARKAEEELSIRVEAFKPQAERLKECEERERAAAQEEERRQAEASAAKEQERYERIMADRTISLPAASAWICAAAARKLSAKREIALEMKYARAGGGIVDKVKLYDLQVAMRDADEKAAVAKRFLKQNKWRALGCRVDIVAVAQACFVARQYDEEVDPACADARLEPLADAVRWIGEENF